MASSQFLEEALSQEIDESAVNALVGTLEGQLENSVDTPNPPQATSVDPTTQNPTSGGVNSGLSNGQIANGPNNSDTSSDSGAKTLTPLQNAPTVVLGAAGTANVLTTKTGDGQVKIVAFPTTTTATTGQTTTVGVGQPQIVSLNSRAFANGAVVNKTMPIGAKPATATATAVATPAGVQLVNVRPAANATQVVGKAPAAVTATVAPGVASVSAATAQPRFVINSPVLRPGAPGTPFTIQSLGGAGGHILVKTETGQLQLIRVAPQPTGATANVGAATNATPVATAQAAQVQVSGATVVVSAAAGTPALTTAQKQQVDTTKEKCRKFLANLLELSSREPKAVERNVRTLIQELIDARVEPEEFCDRLEKLLNASPQPCLIGFLKKSLPLLRQSLFLRQMSIDGIKPPPQNVVQTTVQPQIQIQVPAQQQSQQIRPQVLSQTVRVVAPAHVAGQSINVTTPPRGVAPQRIVTPVRNQLGGKILTALRNTTPTSNSQPPPLHHTIQQPVRVQTTTSVKTAFAGGGKQVKVTAGGGVIAAAAANVNAGKGGARAMAAVKTVAGGIGIGSAGTATVVVPAVKSLAKVAAATSRASASAGGGAGAAFESSAFGGDDDINDVAAMGGVNLAEESQRILGSTELIGTQIRSIKDESFLHSAPLMARIRQIVANHGLDEVNTEVTALVSHACQERLKSLLEKLACLAEHRMEMIRTHPRYEVTQDVKGQIKFLEELDRHERKKHEEHEREMLLRAAKSRSKTEDPEQVKLKAKAKEMQRAEMEEMRQREANITAMQAIGPRKKPRIDGPLGSSTSGSASPGTASMSSFPNTGQELSMSSTSSSSFQRPTGTLLRPRLKRVTIKDLLFLLEQEREPKRSKLLYKAYLK